MKINWRVRLRQPVFWAGLASAVATPVLVANGIELADLTTWDSVGGVVMGVVSNPFLLVTVLTTALSFLGITADPTTEGVKDSPNAMTYPRPKRYDPKHD